MNDQDRDGAFDMRTMRDLARGVLRRIVPQRFRRNGGGGDLLDYWRRRAEAHGARAVLNLRTARAPC
jgi:hypothetical protein